MSPELAKQRYAKTILNPLEWFMTAHQLMFAMRELEPAIEGYWRTMSSAAKQPTVKIPRFEYNSAYLLLAGFVIENMCKGFLCARLSPDDCAKAERGELPKRLDRQHRLDDLLEDVGFSISPSYREILERVQTTLLWLGRYPAPKESENIRWKSITGADVTMVKSFLKQLGNHVTKKS